MEEKYCFAVPQKALIIKDKKFLVLKRGKSAKVYPDYWDLPGGKLEHGEEIKNGLKREVFEETALDIEVGKILFSYLEVNIRHAYIVIFECTLLGGEIKLSKEHSEYKWVTSDEAKKLQLEPFLKEFLSQNQI